MADVWSGDILLPDGHAIKEVGLTSLNVASSTTFSAQHLRFLATVQTARIPLYLAAGPSLDVWTSSEETQAWFESILLSKPATFTDVSSNTADSGWWNLARSQSPIGILVQVQNDGQEISKPSITEILFYGTIVAPTLGGLPTPPSSSPQLHNAKGEQLPELRVHAIPLSSHLLCVGTVAPTAEGEAQFLPHLYDSQLTPQSPARKRDIFEEATMANKKARGRGGHGIAAAAARGSESQQPYARRKFLSIDTKASPIADFRPPSANSTLTRPNSRPLSRSPSISSDGRPLSRKGLPDAHSRRSNLSQVATVPIQPEEPTIQTRNKDALSKVVMAAMRMHGLQQRKKNRSRRASVAPGVEESQSTSEETALEEIAKNDEYKLVYHQTYKGAALAMRKHMSEKPLHAQPDRMRDVVEKLLTIFLTDPLAEPLHSDIPVATPGGKERLLIPGSTDIHASPFDLPSIRRPGMNRSVTDSHVYTGSPVSKNKTDGTDLASP